MSVAEILVDTRAPIDAERLLQWALAPGRAGGIVWRGDRGLAFDQGLTAKPRRKPRGSWALVEAGAAIATHAGASHHLQATVDPDAAIVAAAIDRLREPARSLVTLHARHGTRPRWTERRMVFRPRWSAPGRPWIAYADPWRRRQQYCALDVEVLEESTAAARASYAAWHAGIAEVTAHVAAALSRWSVAGFGAVAQPWGTA